MNMSKTRIAVLVSGGGTNLQALIDAQQSGVITSGDLIVNGGYVYAANYNGANTTSAAYQVAGDIYVKGGKVAGIVYEKKIDGSKLELTFGIGGDHYGDVFEIEAKIDGEKLNHKFYFESNRQAFDAAVKALKGVLTSNGYTEINGGFEK